MRKVAILGSTGSVGRQTIDVIKQYKDDFKITALVAFSNKILLRKQQKEFNVEFVGIIDDKLLSDDDFFYGEESLLKAVDLADVVVVATRGILALPAVIKALKAGKTVAIANKECVISAGELLLEAQKEGKGLLLPIDSEHSAIFQCLNGQVAPEKLIITCSGGAFLGKTKLELEKVNSRDALKHPKWHMGNKITIDSATLINKGFEVLEARWFFGVEPKNIQVVIHPQSVIHSCVEFCDGSILAQLAVTDMRLPIAYALNYPQRMCNNIEKLDLFTIKNLQFLMVDNETFEGIQICIDAYYAHKLMPAVLVSADEVVVDYFLADKIKFNQIYDILKSVCNYYKNNLDCIKFDVEGILFLDASVKEYTKKLIGDDYVISN